MWMGIRKDEHVPEIMDDLFAKYIHTKELLLEHLQKGVHTRGFSVHDVQYIADNCGYELCDWRYYEKEEYFYDIDWPEKNAIFIQGEHVFLYTCEKSNYSPEKYLMLWLDRLTKKELEIKEEVREPRRTGRTKFGAPRVKQEIIYENYQGVGLMGHIAFTKDKVRTDQTLNFKLRKGLKPQIFRADDPNQMAMAASYVWMRKKKMNVRWMTDFSSLCYRAFVILTDLQKNNYPDIWGNGYIEDVTVYDLKPVLGGHNLVALAIRWQELSGTLHPFVKFLYDLFSNKIKKEDLSMRQELADA